MANPTALFVIDIQNDNATHPATRIRAADRVKHAGETILKAARQILDDHRTTSPQPIMIIFIQHEDAPGKGSLLKDTEPWKLVFEPRAGAEGELLFQKTTREFGYLSSSNYFHVINGAPYADNALSEGNTFETNTHLADMLKALGVREIVAFGIQSECCVESTCRGAREAGFGVTLLSGAHSTYDLVSEGKTAEEIEREVEGRLREVGVRVEDWEGVVEGLRGLVTCNCE